MLANGSQEEGVHRFVRLRWIACGAVAVSLPVLHTALPPVAWWACLAAAVLVGASNVVHARLARSSMRARVLLLGQFVSDLILLTLLIGATGGIGAAVSLYTLHVVLAGLLLGRQDALCVAAFALALVTALALAQALGAPFPIAGASIDAYLVGDGSVGPSTNRHLALMVGVPTLIASVILVIILPLVESARERQRRLRATERELTEKTAALEHMLDSLGAGMMVIDDTHHVRWMNRQASAWFPQIVTGSKRSCIDAMVAPTEAEAPCPSCRVFTAGTSWKGDFAFPPAASRPNVFRVYAAPTASPDGRRSVVELVLDVSAERETERQLLQGRKTAALAEFAGGFAHEMNTPLASLAAGLRMVRKRMQVAAAGETNGDLRILPVLGDLADQTERCQRITESLLGFSRQLRGRLEAAEVDAVVRQALGSLAEHRDLTGIEIFAEGADALMPTALCDPTQLQIVLTNVLTNAVDSVRSAARTKGRVRVEVGLRERGAIEVRIRDNGIGMPPEIAERVFDPFFTTKPAGAGSGLGLSVAHGLLEGMGGSITLRSTPDVGTDIVIRLKAAESDLVGEMSAPAHA